MGVRESYTIVSGMWLQVFSFWSANSTVIVSCLPVELISQDEKEAAHFEIYISDPRPYTLYIGYMLPILFVTEDWHKR